MEDNKKQYRTVARTRITDYLRAHSDKSFSAADISAQLVSEGLDINLSTIYRYLNRLCEEGLVNKYVSDRGDMAVFQYVDSGQDCEGHLHLQCHSCGRIIHLNCEFMDEISSHILAHHGFEIMCKGSILFGLCDKCRHAEEVHPASCTCSHCRPHIPSSLLGLILVVFLSLGFCTGCSLKTADARFTGDGALNIMATIFSAYDFAREVAGSVSNVEMLLKPGSEAHSFEPTPADLIALEQCDIFICSGGENDVWVDSILDAINNPDLVIIRMTECVPSLLEEEESDGMQEEGGALMHLLEEEEEEEWDEHVWMDLSNAALICTAICDACCRLDPDNGSIYLSALEQYKSELEAIDCEIAELTEGVSGCAMVFADRFPARYFTERYGLEYFAAFPGCSQNTEASAATISFLIDKVRDDNIAYIYKMELSSGKLAAAVEEETGAQILTFYTGHNITVEDFNNHVSYLDLMHRNIDTLRLLFGSRTF